MERRIRKSGTSSQPSAARRADGADRDLCSALPHLSLGVRSCARADGSAFRFDRRHLSALVSGLQLLGSGLGWLHRFIRNRGADGGGDGHLPGRGRSAQTP